MDIDKHYNKTIVSASMDDGLTLGFADGTSILIFDNGQSCCESRYTSTDDDPQSLVGGMLLKVETKPGPPDDGVYEDVHETAFVEVATTKGLITMVAHNEHNGYYGGFGLTVKEIA